ncbi:MAG TPA: MopE-related protein, partial [Myxococcales bacterium]
MAIGNRTVFGVGVLSLVLSSCSCNTPPPTTNHLLGEGERCDEDDACETALCVALPREDKTCRRTCESGCHSEEICSTFGTGSNGGLRAGCVPVKAGLCLPCAQDADCPYAADACLSVSGAHFCGRDCSYDESCPEGYTCTEGVAAEGGMAPKQCIPKSATCSCIPQTAGLKRPCEIKNSFGTCTGNETCGGTGYANCDARVPAAEACNGVDDDCDGQTDEGMDDVTCGLGECAVTVQACLDGVPQTCTPKGGDAETCNGKDDDCDGKTDEDFDLTTIDRCGSCDNACVVAHGKPGCKAGACYVLDCDPGFDDCDLKYETGCEANLNTDKNNCSMCLNACALPFADARCAAGACEVAKCLEGHWDVDPAKPGCEYGCTPTAGGVEKCDNIDNDCNGQTDDGLDLTADPKNCLSCGNVCPTLNGIAGCSAAGCTIACLPGWADCDPLIPGCETNTNLSNDHCGKCARKCAPANADAFA